MRIKTLYLMFGLIIAFSLFFELAAHADETNQETKITFSEPVQIPGHVLAAGTYLFITDPDDQNLVRVFDADGKVLYAALETTPTEMMKRTDETTVTLAEQSGGEPDLLVKWFYPSNEIAHATQVTLAANRQLPGGYAGSH
jgi:hypothetical protein